MRTRRFIEALHPRDLIGRFARKAKSGKTAKRQKRIASRDRKYFDLQTNQNQFTAKEAKQYVNTEYKDLVGVKISRKNITESYKNNRYRP